MFFIWNHLFPYLKLKSLCLENCRVKLKRKAGIGKGCIRQIKGGMGAFIILSAKAATQIA